MNEWAVARAAWFFVLALLAAYLPTPGRAQAEGSLRIAVLSDPHVNDDPAHAEYLDRFKRAIEQTNAAKADVVLIAGDLSENGKEEQLKEANRLAGTISPSPYLVAGNHDVGGIATSDKPGPSQKRLDLYQKTVGPQFYAADLPRGFRVVAVNTSIMGSGTALEQSQWELLERELGNDVPAQSRVILMHYPPYVELPNEADSYMSLNRPERQRFLELLKRNKAAVVITGHQHRPREVVSLGTRIVTAPPISFGLPRDKQATGWMMVEIGPDKSVQTTIHEVDGPVGEAPSTRVHIFYYPWYGAPPFEKQYVHWVQGGHTPPEDIGSSFYPALGAYSCSDPKVLKQHMQWIRQSRAGVVVISWWGQNSYEDERTLATMDAAAAAGLKVAFHLEPYDGFTPARLAQDLRYLFAKYGSHPAFHRCDEQGRKAVFYTFESLRYQPQEWRRALEEVRPQLEPFLLLAQTSDLSFIETAGFDGGYIYDVLTPFRDSGFLDRWSGGLAAKFAERGKLFVPSVGPGYSDERAVHRREALPEAARTRDSGTGATYDAAWRAAIASDPPFISVTSFNEWHEGSQIEPAIAREIAGYSYPAYPKGGLQYIEQTARWVKQYVTSKPAEK